MISWIKQHSVMEYFIISFVMTWILWIPALVIKLQGGISVFGPDHLIGQFGRWAPGIAAMLLTLLLAGGQGLKKLYKPLGIWRVPIGWYAVALLLPPTLFYLAKLVDQLLGYSYQIVSPVTVIQAPLVFVILSVIITGVPGSFAEELGWRSFALPVLQSKTNAMIASIILALLWGSWHIPLMIYFGDTQVLDIIFGVLNFIPVTILFTWLFNNTRSSLLLVTLFHVIWQFSNNFLGVLPTNTMTVLTWLVAIVVVLYAGPERLVKNG